MARRDISAASAAWPDQSATSTARRDLRAALVVRRDLLPLEHMRWFSLEEERVVQQSSVSISLSFENQGINPVGDHAQVPRTYTKQ